jgi:hypothetical protein
LRERQQQEQQAKLDTPEKRKCKLLQSFKRHNVQMVRTLILARLSCVVLLPAGKQSSPVT